MPVKVQGPDGKTYQFPEGTDKAAAIAYFHSKGIGVAAPPGFRARLGEATGFPTTMEQLKAAQPSTAEKIGGPAVTAGKMAYGYGKNLVSEGRNAISELRQPGNNINTPGTPIPPAIAQFLLRGVLGPVGGTGVANLGEDVQGGNYSGAAGDALGTFINALMLRRSGGPSARKATNYLTSAAGKEMHMPIEKTIPELRESAGNIGGAKSMEDFYSVANNAASVIQKEADAALAPIAAKRVIPNSIAANIRKLITPDMVKTPEGRAETAYINAEAKKFENQPWSYEQLDSKRMRLNAELNTFEKKGAGARYTAAKGNLNTAIDKAIADTIRDVVYPQMDAATGKPPGYFRALKQKQGNLLELQDELNPRNRKSITSKQAAETAAIQGSPRFSRENVSVHVGGSAKPRGAFYGLKDAIKKPNPSKAANKRVGMGFSTGSPTAKAYTTTLPMRSQLFPVPENEEQR